MDDLSGGSLDSASTEVYSKSLPCISEQNSKG